MNQRNKKHFMIRKRYDQQKLSVTKRHMTTLLILSINNILQTGVSVDQNPLQQRVSGGLWCIVSCPFIRKTIGKHGASNTSFWESELEQVPLMERGTLALNILASFSPCVLFFLIFLFFLSSRYPPIWEETEEQEVSFIVSSVCVCAIVVYPRAPEYHRAV